VASVVFDRLVAGLTSVLPSWAASSRADQLASCSISLVCC